MKYEPGRVRTCGLRLRKSLLSPLSYRSRWGPRTLADMVIEVKGVGKPGKEGSKHEGKVFTNIYWNGEISLEALADLDERVKATYLPFLEEALAAEA